MPPTHSDLEARVSKLELENARLREQLKRKEISDESNFQASTGLGLEANRQSAHRYRYLRSIVDNMPAMIGYWDNNLLNCFANRAYSTWLGIDPEKMPNVHIREVLGEERYHLNLPYIEGVLRGEAQEFERTIPSPNGKFVRHALAEYVPDIVNGKVEGFIAQVSDITKIKEAERINKLLEFSLNQVREAIFLINEAGQFYYVNEAACLSVGYGRRELLGFTVADINPDLPGEKWAEYRKQNASAGSLTYQARHKHKDGTVFPVEVSAMNFDFSGQSFSLTIVRDMTEQDKIKNTMQFHSEILMNIHEGVQITRISDQTIVYSTPVFNQMFGYTENELIGKKVSRLNAQTTKSADERSSEINSVLHDSGYWQGQILNARKDGSTFWCWVKISIFDHHEYGKVWVAVHEDISLRKQAELEIQRIRDSVNRDFLVREVHHRIKNNLQGITGVLRQHVRTHPELAGPLNEAISQVQSVAIIHGLKGQTGVAEVRLCDLISAVSADMESMWNKQISVDIPSNWSACRIVESETVPIALIMNELIANALKHGGSDDNVTVKLRHKPNDNSVTVSIYNSGFIPAGFGVNNPDQFGVGLQLVLSLVPQVGARLYWEQDQKQVVTQFELDIPIVHLES